MIPAQGFLPNVARRGALLLTRALPVPVVATYGDVIRTQRPSRVYTDTKGAPTATLAGRQRQDFTVTMTWNNVGDVLLIDRIE